MNEQHISNIDSANKKENYQAVKMLCCVICCSSILLFSCYCSYKLGESNGSKSYPSTSDKDSKDQSSKNKFFYERDPELDKENKQEQLSEKEKEKEKAYQMKVDKLKEDLKQSRLSNEKAKAELYKTKEQYDKLSDHINAKITLIISNYTKYLSETIANNIFNKKYKYIEFSKKIAQALKKANMRTRYVPLIREEIVQSIDFNAPEIKANTTQI